MGHREYNDGKSLSVAENINKQRCKRCFTSDLSLFVAGALAKCVTMDKRNSTTNGTGQNGKPENAVNNEEA